MKNEKGWKEMGDKPRLHNLVKLHKNYVDCVDISNTVVDPKDEYSEKKVCANCQNFETPRCLLQEVEAQPDVFSFCCKEFEWYTGVENKHQMVFDFMG